MIFGDSTTIKEACTALLAVTPVIKAGSRGGNCFTAGNTRLRRLMRDGTAVWLQAKSRYAENYGSATKVFAKRGQWFLALVGDDGWYHCYGQDGEWVMTLPTNDPNRSRFTIHN